MPTATPLIILTTLPAGGNAAETFAQTLVERRVAACVNVLPAMTSIYSWRGTIERGEERQLLIKTTADQLPKIEAAFTELHPYDVPELVTIEIAGGSAAYLEWIISTVSG